MMIVRVLPKEQKGHPVVAITRERKDDSSAFMFITCLHNAEQISAGPLHKNLSMEDANELHRRTREGKELLKSIPCIPCGRFAETNAMASKW